MPKPSQNNSSPQKQRLEVMNKVSLYDHRVNTARWNIKGDFGTIVQFMPPIWDDAMHHSLFYEHDHPDEVMQDFVGSLIFTYLMERICIERAHERIRLKRDKCTPCVIAPIANKMFEHIIESWL
jgi:hypothetical protein